MGPLPFFPLTPRKEEERTHFPGNHCGAKQTDLSDDKTSIMLYLCGLCLPFLPDIPHGHKAQDHVGQALFPVTLEELAAQKGHLSKRIPRDCQLQGQDGHRGTVTRKNSSVSMKEPCSPMSALILGRCCRIGRGIPNYIVLEVANHPTQAPQLSPWLCRPLVSIIEVTTWLEYSKILHSRSFISWESLVAPSTILSFQSTSTYLAS